MRLSSLMEVVVTKASLGGKKRLHEIDTFDSDKDLVSSTNLKLSPLGL